jgi:hypothetical protein
LVDKWSQIIYVSMLRASYWEDCREWTEIENINCCISSGHIEIKFAQAPIFRAFELDRFSTYFDFYFTFGFVTCILSLEICGFKIKSQNSKLNYHSIAFYWSWIFIDIDVHWKSYKGNIVWYYQKWV